MRPLSLRKKMEESAGASSKRPITAPDPAGAHDDLVTRLSSADHPVEVSMSREKTAREFLRRLKEGFVRIKFTDTTGGTELGFKLIPEATHMEQADFDNENGTVHLEGKLMLDFRKVQVCSRHRPCDTPAGGDVFIP